MQDEKTLELKNNIEFLTKEIHNIKHSLMTEREIEIKTSIQQITKKYDNKIEEATASLKKELQQARNSYNWRKNYTHVNKQSQTDRIANELFGKNFELLDKEQANKVLAKKQKEWREKRKAQING